MEGRVLNRKRFPDHLGHCAESVTTTRVCGPWMTSSTRDLATSGPRLTGVKGIALQAPRRVTHRALGSADPTAVSSAATLAPGVSPDRGHM